MRSIITVKCPECGGFLEIDVSRQRVLSHKLELGDDPKRDKAELFDDVVKRVKDRESRGDDLFDAAKRSVEENDERLDELFGDVKKKIEHEKSKGEEPGQDPRDLFWD